MVYDPAKTDQLGFGPDSLAVQLRLEGTWKIWCSRSDAITFAGVALAAVQDSDLPEHIVRFTLGQIQPLPYLVLTDKVVNLGVMVFPSSPPGNIPITWLVTRCRV